MAELLTKDRKHVAILQNIKVDRELPKHKDKKKKEITPNNQQTWITFNSNDTGTSTGPIYTSIINSQGQFDPDAFLISNNDISLGDWENSLGETNPPKKLNWFDRQINRIKGLLSKKEVKFDVIQFFADVKDLSTKEIDTYVNRLEEYLQCIAYAKQSGQKALMQRMTLGMSIHKYESILFSKGMYKAITEQAIVKLALGSDKALSLDYLENYSRIIPVEVLKKKFEIDQLNVFDNYCILHYDPDGIAYKETAEEIRKRKDPILFGLIKGSNKLYFIADWVDEYCDLTFDKLIEKLGKKVAESGYLKDKINTN